MFRVIRLTTRNKQPILNAIKSKPADFFAKVVRHLSLEIALEEEAREILEVCSGVINLALNPKSASSTLLPILANMPLQWLATSLHDLFDGVIIPEHPLFASLTHLDVFDIHEKLPPILVYIPTFPVLSRLALDSAVSRDTVKTLLVECPRLELLLVLWSSEVEYKSAQIPHLYDVRFVIGLCFNNYWGDWEAGARGLPHFWSLGDDFVARKRSKVIEGTVLPSGATRY